MFVIITHSYQSLIKLQRAVKCLFCILTPEFGNIPNLEFGCGFQSRGESRVRGGSRVRESLERVCKLLQLSPGLSPHPLPARLPCPYTAHTSPCLSVVCTKDYILQYLWSALCISAARKPLHPSPAAASQPYGAERVAPRPGQ